MRARPGPRVAAIAAARSSASPSTRSALPPASAARSVSLQPRSGQRREQAGVPADVLEPLGLQVDPVVVAPEPDVLDARDLPDVLAVRDDVVDGRRGRRVGAAVLGREGGVRE